MLPRIYCTLCACGIVQKHGALLAAACSVDGTPQCCSCNKLKPVAEEWVSLQDGRQLCLECLDTLVVDTKDAQPLYDEVRQMAVGRTTDKSDKG